MDLWTYLVYFEVYLGNLICINPILGASFIIENLSYTEEVGQGMLAYSEHRQTHSLCI